jgi:ubiquinone biosynthesis protein
MLKESLIPTPLIRPEERSPIIIDEIASEDRLRVGYLMTQVVKLGAHLLWLKLRRKADPVTLGKLLARFFQQMGVLWIKMGQLLSLRLDILPAEVCDELSRLQDQAHGFNLEYSRQLIEEDLGGPLEQYFSYFSETPFAAASISQVHRARLKDGNVWVAVKVRKPDAHKTFARDISVIRWMVATLNKWSIHSHMRWQDMLWEIEQLMTEELDYHYEMANIQRMKKVLARHNIYVPKVFAQYCSKRIIVMEFVHGVVMADYLKIAASDPLRLETWCKENNVLPRRLGKRLFFSNLRQLFEDNLFHGDLHPGNIVILRDSKIAFIDFGSIGFSDRDFLEKYSLYLEAMIDQQYAKVFDIYLLFPDNIPAADLTDLKERFILILQKWQDRSKIKDLPYREKNISAINDDLLGVLGEYRITMTWSVLRFLRASTTLDAAIRELIPEISVPKLLKVYFRGRSKRQFKKMMPPHQVFDLNNLSSLVKAPIHINESMVFRGSVVRRLALVFKSTSNKIADGLNSVFSFISGLLRLTGVYLIACLFANYEAPWLLPLLDEWWLAPLNGFPKLDIQVWGLIFVVLLYADRVIAKLRRSCNDAK